MELATGAVRYEFSGPGALGWFAAFTPDGSAFLASQLFGSGVLVWPTAEPSAEHRKPPTPRGALDLPKGTVQGAVVSRRGHVAVHLQDGTVHLRALAGEAPALAPLPGTGPSQVAFDATGDHLLAVRGGKAWVWSLTAPVR